jgi:hypothetical protein
MRLTTLQCLLGPDGQDWSMNDAQERQHLAEADRHMSI